MKHPLSGLAPVLSLDEVNVLREATHNVYIDPLLRRWAIRLVRATREADGVAIGASVRGSPRPRALGARVGTPLRA